MQAREVGQRQKSRIVIFANEFTVAKALVHVVGTKKSLASYSRGKGASTRLLPDQRLSTEQTCCECGCLCEGAGKTGAGMASCHIMHHLMFLIHTSCSLHTPSSHPSKPTGCEAENPYVSPMQTAAHSMQLNKDPACTHRCSYLRFWLGRTQANPLLGESAERRAARTKAGFQN
jgi:hypothetical protein